MEIHCPICSAVDCYHFIGWITEDGKSIEDKNGNIIPLKPDDIVVKTGVSIRVYRDN